LIILQNFNGMNDKEWFVLLFQEHTFFKIDVGGCVAILVFNKDLNIKN